MTLGEAMDTKNAQRLVEKKAEQIFRLIKQNKKN